MPDTQLPSRFSETLYRLRSRVIQYRGVIVLWVLIAGMCAFLANILATGAGE